jgi:hypothetical protein
VAKLSANSRIQPYRQYNIKRPFSLTRALSLGDTIEQIWIRELVPKAKIEFE